MEEPAAHEECQICPICTMLRVMSTSRPEVLGHLLEASRALTAALQALLADPEHAGPPASDRLRRIDLDENPEGQEPTSNQHERPHERRSTEWM